MLNIERIQIDSMSLIKENGNNKTRVRFNLPSAGPKQSSTDPNKLKYLSVDNNSSSSIGLSTSHNVDSDNKLVITENSDNSSSSSMSSLRKSKYFDFKHIYMKHDRIRSKLNGIYN